MTDHDMTRWHNTPMRGMEWVAITGDATVLYAFPTGKEVFYTLIHLKPDRIDGDTIMAQVVLRRDYVSGSRPGSGPLHVETWGSGTDGAAPAAERAAELRRLLHDELAEMPVTGQQTFWNPCRECGQPTAKRLRVEERIEDQDGKPYTCLACLVVPAEEIK